MRSKIFWFLTLIFTVTSVLIVFPCSDAVADEWELIDDDDWCRDRWYRGHDSVCEVRELIVREDWKTIVVDGRVNGGIKVEGWNKDYIRIRAKVSASAREYDDARDMLEDIEILVDRRGIRAEGPERRGRHRSWSVSYHLMVPRKSNLELKTHNGGISIHDVDGEICADATNGGMNLSRLAGDVKARTTNGGLTVRLYGDTWDGEGLDANTTNGSVKLLIPRDYSARLITGTVNGSVEVDFPITVQGKINKRLRTTLGDGGPTVRATTTNGSVRLTKK